MSTSLGLGSLYAVLTADIKPLERNMHTAKKAVQGFATDFKRQMNNVQSKALDMNRVLSGIGSALLVRKLIDYADQYTLIQSRMGLATHSTKEFSRANEELEQVALRTRTGLKDTTNLYYRMERSTRDLDRSQSDLLKVTELVNKSVIVSGEAGASAQAALVQFSQGLQSGVLRGEELNSVMEQSPILAQQLAAGLKVPIGALRDLGQAGKLTTDTVFKALLSRVDSVNGEFKQMKVTVASAFTALEQTALVVFLGKIDQAGKFTERLSSAMMSLAESMITISRSNVVPYMATFVNLLITLTKLYAPILAFRLALVAISSGWGTLMRILVSVGGALAKITAAWSLLRTALTSGVLFKAVDGFIRLKAGASAAAGQVALLGIQTKTTNTGLVMMNRSALLAKASLAGLASTSGILFAAWAGWEIGTWVTENFQMVRLGMAALVASVQIGLEEIKYGFSTMLLVIRREWNARFISLFTDGKLSKFMSSIWTVFVEKAKITFNEIISIVPSVLTAIVSLFEKVFTTVFAGIVDDVRQWSETLADLLENALSGTTGLKDRLQKAFLDAAAVHQADTEQLAESVNNLSHAYRELFKANPEISAGFNQQMEANLTILQKNIKKFEKEASGIFQSELLLPIAGNPKVEKDPERRYGMDKYLFDKLKEKYTQQLELLNLTKAEQKLLQDLEKQNAKTITKGSAEYTQLLALVKKVTDEQAKIKSAEETKEKNLQLQKDFSKEMEKLYANDVSVLRANLLKQVELYRQAGVSEVELEMWKRQAMLEISTNAYDGLQRAAQDYFSEIGNQAKNMETAFKSVADSLEDTLLEALKKGKLDLSSFLDTLTSAILQMMIIRPLLSGFGNMLGFGGDKGSSGSRGGLAGLFAKGGAFSGGRVKAFANGGLVDGPTFFPMSHNRTGLMGEAGPEAIMPLTKTKGGKLGISTDGAGGNVTIIQNMTFAEGVNNAARQEIYGAMPEIRRQAVEAVIDYQARKGRQF